MRDNQSIAVVEQVGVQFAFKDPITLNIRIRVNYIHFFKLVWLIMYVNTKLKWITVGVGPVNASVCLSDKNRRVSAEPPQLTAPFKAAGGCILETE